MDSRPWRSALYIPASRPRAMEKARGLPCDAILFDLEDAVAPAEKPSARTALAQALTAGGYGPRARIVRINALSTEWGAEDLSTIAPLSPDGLLLPKVSAPEELSVVAERAPGIPLWAMIESPAGVLNAPAIAAHPALAGLVLGTNDLAEALGATSRAGLAHALQATLLAGRAAGRVVLDGVCNAFRDETQLRAECAEGRAWGFDGKTLIHPAQIAAANEIFGPSPEELAHARAVIDAHAEAEAAGQGVAVLEGRIVESLHVRAARVLLARANAIEERGTWAG
ncbi:HpcH/HpaI aldolase/citrate lyase family protein [Pseudoroseicyclus tamaricis]|uniref:CoA ester lyase n=1 Tax=Pseudoroseicyclus tamaricis TaxID=2705421 RepID=A0A6B2JTP2_9RHOB|nr:CoA ester lyase [Pseudoroseicyclus tamaricis]NDU99958.1 CoA ester lyase [Pseudoroseicyclus tamaricis]